MEGGGYIPEYHIFKSIHCDIRLTTDSVLRDRDYSFGGAVGWQPQGCKPGGADEA